MTDDLWLPTDDELTWLAHHDPERAAELEALLTATAAHQRQQAETVADLACRLDPTYVVTPAIARIATELQHVYLGRTRRLMVFLPPQEGKSESVSHYGNLHALRADPELRIAEVSYELETATRWGRAVRTDIETYDGTDGTVDLGLRLRHDTRAAGRWQLEGHRGGMYCVGIGGALTGRPVDGMVIDDPVKGPEQADSIVYRERCWEWWTHVARARLAPDAWVVMILTRWHEDDIAGRILSDDEGDWRVVSIPALAEKDDPLDRPEGEWLQSTRGRTGEQWEQIRREVGARAWAALYQQRPTPLEGAIFKRASIDGNRVPADGTPEMLTVREYVDPSFSDSPDADETGRMVMGLGVDGKVYLLADLTERTAYERISHGDTQASHGTTVVKIEQNMLGRKVIETLKGIVPSGVRVEGIEARGTKAQRAEAAAALVDNGQVKFAGRFHSLEDQLLRWVATDRDSPDRMDAFSHGVYDLGVLRARAGKSSINAPRGRIDSGVTGGRRGGLAGAKVALGKRQGF